MFITFLSLEVVERIYFLIAQTAFNLCCLISLLLHGKEYIKLIIIVHF